MNNLKAALNQEVYAVVGASQNKTKYGYKIFNFLKDHGLSVYPINPNNDKIDGITCYNKLTDVSRTIDVVVTVVPAKITKHIVKEAADLGIDYVWMQPGSEFEDAEEFCEGLGINPIIDQCIMVEMKSV